MDFLQVPSNENEIILNTPNRNEILKDGPPQNSNGNILGRGAYGTVFKALFKGKQVAVKIIKNARDMNRQSMRNETNILGWKHNNIVRIMKIESTPNFGIVIMERFTGQCLQIILDSIELPLEHRVFVSLDIVSALAYCHRRQLLHLDVKPQNVLVAFPTSQSTLCSRSLVTSKRRTYVCKLCDFGTSMKLDDDQKENAAIGTTMGTVRYMSPEALREEPLTPAADIYSLGISMWQLQHRSLPYSWIECNEVVAYQVVKNNMRPDDADDAEGLLSGGGANGLHGSRQRHRNCLCEHFSSEISHSSLEHIKNFLNQSENTRIREGLTENSCKLREFPLRKERIPFRELNPQNLLNATRDLGSEFALSATVKGKEKPMGPSIDFQLEAVFRSFHSHKRMIREERLFEALYKSCWHSDFRRRPSVQIVRRRLEEMFVQIFQ